MRRVASLLVVLLGMATVGLSQMTPPVRNPDGTINKSKGLGVDQKIGNQVPLNLAFVNSQGQRVTLNQYFGKSPVLLNLVYFNCKAVCTVEEQALLASFAKMEKSSTLPMRIGRDVQILSISINPTETPSMAAAKKAEIVPNLDYNAGQGWHFLTGDQDSIQKLVSSVGFQFTYDPKDNLINHPAALILLTPDGKVSQYFFGDDYPERPFGQAISAASANKLGQTQDFIFFGCLAKDPRTGQYTVDIEQTLKVVGSAWVLILAGGIFYLSRRYKSVPPYQGGHPA